ncbi:MAG TPA: single-stranded-DNA-specific exonuclease RecJ [Patescibacteria group bacterium]|nr:single-stranded-DNA-specific exonuclease RecJ [Patescibacteria group bacterium]
MKKWQIRYTPKSTLSPLSVRDIISVLLLNRGLKTKKEIEEYLHPKNPYDLTAKDVDISFSSLAKAVKRINKAIRLHESIIVYADYDADGITAGAIMWETIHKLGGNVMPYIPDRAEEGYGLSKKGIDSVFKQYTPSLIVTVDHGISAYDKVEYAKSLGIDVVVTDHHMKPKKLPDCVTVHTTSLCGAGVSWFVAKELDPAHHDELLALATIGTIADLVPLIGANRSITKFGLAVLNKTKRIGLTALISDAGLTKGELSTFDISHVIAPRINAMGRLVHAMDALRLMCTNREDKAMLLARKLSLTNKERQQLTVDTSAHAKGLVQKDASGNVKKLLFIAHESYNPGIIGLVAGRLVEEYYRPSIVLSVGEIYSKASARSITGFNIVDAIRSCSDILVDVGGHPMAAGFTVETKNLDALERRLSELAEKELGEEQLLRVLPIDVALPLSNATEDLWRAIQEFEPFGFGNPEPLFSSTGVEVVDSRLVGAEGKHMKLKLRQAGVIVDAIAFGLGKVYPSLRPDKPIDIAYSIDMNTWNGSTRLQLKIKDIKVV